ncbi:MAG: Rieske 2Fe-2S domain-containing protein, partial [Dehalococcoidia bacterium]|nr:Rieske 2Fe-2S domain-containing protein [Dehalococcoidia bacterium]
MVLHRGRKLVTHGGCKHEFQCPYHGLTWNLDGSFKRKPFGWDFPQIDRGKFGLPEIRLETWGGFVFVNFDEGAPPLLE